jgi:NAD(P)-dependent dehydrogenase (short-subunit alcohol dehydrogenase family)
MSLKGKVPVITGGGQGIRKAIAFAFLKKGMNVVIAEIDREAGKKTEADCGEIGKILVVHMVILKETEGYHIAC